MFVWIEGISLAIVWLGVMFWLGLAVDYLPVLVGANELAQGARGILLAIVGGVLCYILFRFVGQRAFVQFNDRSLALLLERRFDDLQDALVTTVTLKERQERREQEQYIVPKCFRRLHKWHWSPLGQLMSMKCLTTAC